MTQFGDPTYVKSEIDANRVWRRAFYLSEMRNDNAPIGWSKYITQAECELATPHTCHGNEHMPPGPCIACEIEKWEYGQGN